MKFEPKEDIKRIHYRLYRRGHYGAEHQVFRAHRRPVSGRGATGLALLIQRAGDLFFHVTVPYTVVNVALNAVPVYIGFRYIGRNSLCIPA